MIYRDGGRKPGQEPAQIRIEVRSKYGLPALAQQCKGRTPDVAARPVPEVERRNRVWRSQMFSKLVADLFNRPLAWKQRRLADNRQSVGPDNVLHQFVDSVFGE